MDADGNDRLVGHDRAEREPENDQPVTGRAADLEGNVGGVDEQRVIDAPGAASVIGKHKNRRIEGRPQVVGTDEIQTVGGVRPRSAVGAVDGKDQVDERAVTRVGRRGVVETDGEVDGLAEHRLSRQIQRRQRHGLSRRRSRKNQHRTDQQGQHL